MAQAERSGAVGGVPPDVGVLTAPGAVVEVEREPGAGDVRLRLWTERDAASARAAAGLVREAVRSARTCSAPRVLLVLEAASPVTAVVLDVLRSETVADPERLLMRRAGSSVVVDVVLGRPSRPSR